MAEVVLKLTGDTTDAESDLARTANTLAGVGKAAEKTSSDIKKGFDEVAASAKKANDEISNPKPTENQKRVLNATQLLKKEIKDLEAAALAAGEGTAEFARNIALAGQKKADLKDLKEAISALDPDAVAKSFLGLASSIAGGFSVAQSAIALTGTKSEELEKTLLKVQAAQGLLAGLQQLANTQDELGKARIIVLNKLQGIELKKISAQIETQIALTGLESAEVTTLTAAKEAQAAANAELTISQRILNLVMASNPIGLLIAALAVLGGIVAAYISQTGTAAKAEEQRATAIDGTIIKSKELRDAYNESIVTLKEVENQYAVLNGTLTETEAALSNLAEKNKIATREILNETNAKITETGGVYEELFRFIKSGGDAVLAANTKNQEILKIEQEGANKLKAIKVKENADVAKIQADADAKAAKEKERKQKEANDKFLQNEKAFQDALKNLYDKSEQARIAGLTGSERIEAERKLNQDSINELQRFLEEKARLVGKDLSSDQLNQLDLLRIQADKDANDKLLKQQRDFREKATADEEKANQEAVELAKKLVDENLKTLEESDKARILLTKEGSKARLDAEIEAIKNERDFILENTKLTADQKIIIEQEALQKISDLQKDFAKKAPSSLAKLLGITDEELGKILKVLSKAGSEIKKFIDAQFDAQNKLLDNELKSNEESIKAKEDKIKSLEDQLSEELELQRQGLANNVDAIQQALNSEQAAKQAALENEKKIKEEKKKLALAQLAIDSATQISDLVTASAEIFKVFSSIPIIGVPLAISVIGLMIGSFISSKAKAVQAINSGFKDGGYTGDIGENEVAGPVHGKEFVSTAKTTKKHRSLLEALHSEDYSNLTFKDLSPLLEGTGVTINKDVINEIRTDQSVYNQRKDSEPKEMIDLMKKTNKNIGQFFSHYKNEPKTQRNSDGSETVQIGNTKRTIRKK